MDLDMKRSLFTVHSSGGLGDYFMAKMGFVLHSHTRFSYKLEGPHHLTTCCFEQEEELLP